MMSIKHYNEDIDEPSKFTKQPNQSEIIKSKADRLFRLNPNLEQIQNDNIKMKEVLEIKE